MFNKIKYIVSVMCAGAILTSTGCDWSSGGGSDGYNTSSVVVDVAGVYRSPTPGAPVVVDFSSRGGSSDGVIQVRGEVLAVGNGRATTFSGRFTNDEILGGSVQINGAGYSFVDDGAGRLVGNPAGSGAVNYNTGAWSLNFNGVAPADGERITGSFSYRQTSSGLGSGASQTTIYQFNVQQTGNRIIIIDSNGDRYEGLLGSTQVGGAGNAPSTQSTRIQFQADGNSRGVPVTLSGIFTAEVDSALLSAEENVSGPVSGTSIAMDGTWIEPNGAGDIYGIIY